MEQESPIEKQLQEIWESNNLDQLASFEDHIVWQKMTDAERLLLAILLVKRGSRQLDCGESVALESFSLAQKIAPNHPHLLFHLGTAYASQLDNLRCLQSSCQAFQAAVLLDPTLCEAWSGWGAVLAQIGLSQNEAAPLQEGLKKFEMGALHLQKLSREQQQRFQEQWGWCWCMLGRYSGEAQDFHIALEHYHLAAELGLDTAEFWVEYGNALIELSTLINCPELILKATVLFRSAINLKPDYFEPWHLLACSFQRLIELTKEGSYFQFAMECFGRAAALDPNVAGVWLYWGKLLLDAGSDAEYAPWLQEASKKFEHAHQLDPDNAAPLAYWAEAETICGSLEERLDLLRSGEEKIVHSLRLNSSDPNAWLTYGTVLLELAYYFEDYRLCDQAIEKMRYGLSLNSSLPELWHALALAYFFLGESRQEACSIEQAVSYFSKAVNHSREMVPYFWNDWGVALLALFEITEERAAVEAAIQKFERVLGRDWTKEQKEIECLYNYGSALDMLGGLTEDPQDYEKAIQVLTLVLQLNAAHPQARHNLALAYLHLGQMTDEIESYQMAIEHFQVLCAQDQEDLTIWNDWGVALTHVGYLVRDASRLDISQYWYEQAEEKLLHAITLGALSTFYPLACLYSLMGNHTAAMHYIEKAEVAGMLPSVDEVLQDEWLENLRCMPDFRNFIIGCGGPDVGTG